MATAGVGMRLNWDAAQNDVMMAGEGSGDRGKLSRCTRVMYMSDSLTLYHRTPQGKSS